MCGKHVWYRKLENIQAWSTKTVKYLQNQYAHPEWFILYLKHTFEA